MVFSSPLFLFYFLPVILLLYYLVPRKQIFWKNVVLLIGSLFFYAWGEPVYVLLMLFSIVMDYGLGLWLEHEKTHGGHPGRVLALAVVLNLLLLGFFKYANFLIGTINGVTGLAIPLLELSLPIGISFYTFQALSYIIDLYRGEVEVQRSALNFGTYVSLFPQLIAGPIVRMKTVAGELQDRQETFPEFSAGVRRFIVGLAKKALLANAAGEIWETVSAMEMESLPALTAWIGLAAYTFQIYFDFSGYSDMAIGLGRMFGFHFEENFRYPYVAASITDFWRRWHITLSTWFREYVYIPLGGNRKGLAKQIRNILVVWLLTGIWHGAGWNFVVWGLYFGLILMVEKMGLLRLLEKIPGFFRHVYTMFLVMLSWAVFAFDSLGQGVRFIGALFGGGGLVWNGQSLYLLYSSAVLLVLLILGSTEIPRKAALLVGKRLKARPILSTVGELGLLLAGFALCVAYLVDASYNPFLYFRF